MRFDGDKLRLDKEDQCSTCTHCVKELKCPMVQGIAEGFLTLETDDGFIVTGCELYSEHARHLKIVK